MKKKIIIILSILLIGVLGFLGYKQYQYIEDKKPLIEITEDEIVIDLTEKFDPYVYLTKIKKNTTVEYRLNERKSYITLIATQGEKVEEYERDVKIIYPEIEYPDTITYDYSKQDEFDINQYIKTSQEANIDYEIDINAEKLTADISIGEYSKTVNINLDVINKVWPRVYEIKVDEDWTQRVILYEDLTGFYFSAGPTNEEYTQFGLRLRPYEITKGDGYYRFKLPHNYYENVNMSFGSQNLDKTFKVAQFAVVGKAADRGKVLNYLTRNYGAGVQGDLIRLYSANSIYDFKDPFSEAYPWDFFVSQLEDAE